ncbi:MAG TPA: acyl carrier protein [Gemmatimonadaceae bacterium]|nr:acyl carrier protein [Gemmatimonadaceae bacterium]
MDTLQTIKELAATQFGAAVDAIDESASVDKLGIDSLGFLEFMFEVEDKFGVSVPQESLSGVRTLKELAVVVDGVLAAKSAATT